MSGLELPSEEGEYKIHLKDGTSVVAHYFPSTGHWQQNGREIGCWLHVLPHGYDVEQEIVGIEED